MAYMKTEPALLESAGSGMQGKRSVDDEPSGDVRLHVLCGNIGQIVLQCGSVDPCAADFIPADGVIIAGKGEHIGVGHVKLDLVFEGLDLDGDTVLQGAKFLQVMDAVVELGEVHTHSGVSFLIG